MFFCAKNDLSCLRRHLPTCFGQTRYIRRHSPTYFARTRYIRRHSPTYFARTRQTRPHSPKGFFEKNVTRLDTFARVIRHSGEFGASGHCLSLKQNLSWYFYLVYNWTISQTNAGFNNKKNIGGTMCYFIMYLLTIKVNSIFNIL